MQGFPLIPRAEMSLWRAGRGAALILKDEWRPSQRSLSFFPPPPAPRTPTPLPYPASLPCFSAPRASTPIYACEYMHAKSPRFLPHLGWGKPGAFWRYPLRRCLLRRYLRRYPLMVAVMPWVLRSGGTPVRVRAVRCRARVRCRGLRTGVRHLRVRRAGSAAWRSSRA